VEAPKGYEPSAAPIFDGGTQEDQDALLKLYYDLRLANDALDKQALRKVWSTDPGCIFFNTNGHAYHGIEDWDHIWDHYKTRLRLQKPGGSGTIRITIRGDMALVTDDDVGRYWEWTGAKQQPDFLVDKPYMRATQVCLKEKDGWRVIHAHFSSGRRGKRPDQGGPE
jgi:ketosteroid isomerase-like protein